MSFSTSLMVRHFRLHSNRPFVEVLGLLVLGLFLGMTGQAKAQPTFVFTTLDVPGSSAPFTTGGPMPPG
jgi:hypothetical protein